MSKSKPKEGKDGSKEAKKKKKTVSYQEDDKFDAVLNAASGGFVGTERDELVQKGLLTPFHKLKGFKRSIQQSGPSSLVENGDDTVDHASESAAWVARFLAETALGRPTTKLLGPGDLPKLDAPTHSFNRLKRPLKVSGNLACDEEKSNGAERKKRRPLAGRKWRKRVDKEEIMGVETGRFCGVIMARRHRACYTIAAINTELQFQSSLLFTSLVIMDAIFLPRSLSPLQPG